MILTEESVLFKRLGKFSKLAFTTLVLTWKTEIFSNICFFYVRLVYICHFRNEIIGKNWIFIILKNLSIWGFELIETNLFKIKLKIVWSHLKAFKISCLRDNLFKKIENVSCYSLHGSISEGFFLASNEINRLCIIFANFPFIFSLFACLKSSFLLSIVSSLKSSFIYSLFSQIFQELFSHSTFSFSL